MITHLILTCCIPLAPYVSCMPSYVLLQMADNKVKTLFYEEKGCILALVVHAGSEDRQYVSPGPPLGCRAPRHRLPGRQLFFARFHPYKSDSSSKVKPMLHLLCFTLLKA